MYQPCCNQVFLFKSSATCFLSVITCVIESNHSPWTLWRLSVMFLALFAQDISEGPPIHQGWRLFGQRWSLHLSTSAIVVGFWTCSGIILGMICRTSLRSTHPSRVATFGQRWSQWSSRRVMATSVHVVWTIPHATAWLVNWFQVFFTFPLFPVGPFSVIYLQKRWKEWMLFGWYVGTVSSCALFALFPVTLCGPLWQAAWLASDCRTCMTCPRFILYQESDHPREVGRRKGVLLGH